MRFLFILALAFVGLLGLSTGPSYAQATRTWVSGVGDDVNPCSRTAPCKTFAGAISKTAPKGEINVLDPGGFGAVTITKSITIRSDHIEAGISAPGVAGIIINAASTDKIVIEGLDIDGFGTGTNGVDIRVAGQVAIIRCAIRRFAQNGVTMPNTTTGVRAVIKDSMINLNNGGVNVQGTNNLTIILDTTIDANTAFAAQADGATNVFGIAKSYLTGSPTGLGLLNGATAATIGTSNFLAGAGAFTSTTPFK